MFVSQKPVNMCCHEIRLSSCSQYSVLEEFTHIELEKHTQQFGGIKTLTLSTRYIISVIAQQQSFKLSMSFKDVLGWVSDKSSQNHTGQHKHTHFLVLHTYSQNVAFAT